MAVIFSPIRCLRAFALSTSEANLCTGNWSSPSKRRHGEASLLSRA